MEKKVVIITGSARGFGLEMAKLFKKNGFAVLISDINEKNLEVAKEELRKIPAGEVDSSYVDVTSYDSLVKLWDTGIVKFGRVDIWINNAGVNQPNKPLGELTQREIDFLLDVDLSGAIYGSTIAFERMKKQGSGAIYNIEGYGSNDAMMTGLNLYGTSKRAITHFTIALAKESEELTKGKVIVGRITPGIMITDFIKNANGDTTKVELSEKTKNIYNILGDYASTIAEYIVPRIIKNKKNNAKIVWLSNARAFGKFFKAMFKKNNFFD